KIKSKNQSYIYSKHYMKKIQGMGSQLNREGKLNHYTPLFRCLLCSGKKHRIIKTISNRTRKIGILRTKINPILEIMYKQIMYQMNVIFTYDFLLPQRLSVYCASLSA